MPRASIRSDRSGGAYSNPPFHRNFLGLSLPFGHRTTLTRGKIVREFPENGITYSCNFLYNPSQLTLSASQNTDNPPLPKIARDPNDVTHYILSTGTAIQFSLLFDRTYDLMEGVLPGSEVGHSGVQVDIDTLYYITGMKTLKGDFNRLIELPMVPNTVFVYFGGPDSLKFYGYFDSLNITYSHWTQFMVPIRAEASLSMQIYPPGGSGNIPTPAAPPSFASKIISDAKGGTFTGKLLNDAHKLAP